MCKLTGASRDAFFISSTTTLGLAGTNIASLFAIVLTVHYTIGTVQSVDWNIHRQDEDPARRLPSRCIEEVCKDKFSAILVGHHQENDGPDQSVADVEYGAEDLQGWKVSGHQIGHSRCHKETRVYQPRHIGLEMSVT